MSSIVIDAGSGNWSLVGDVRLTTRADIAEWCTLPPGTEDDHILLTVSGGTVHTHPIFRFQAAAIIVYGAIMGDLGGAISSGIDGETSSGPLPAADIAAAESHSLAGDAACGLILATENNLETDVLHEFEISPVGDINFAIFSVQLFQQPFETSVLSTTLGSSSESSSPSPSSSSQSPTRASITGRTTTSSRTSGSASSTDIVKSPSPPSSPAVAVIIAVVVGLLMLLALVGFLLFRRHRRRRRPIPPGFIIDSDESAPLDDGFLVVTPLPGNDPYARTDEKSRLLHASDFKSRQEQVSMSGSGATSPGISTPRADRGNVDTRPSGSRGGPAGNAEQVQALNDAMQRVGFSPAVLLDLLNRVHARMDPVPTGTPAEVRTKPPKRRE